MQFEIVKGGKTMFQTRLKELREAAGYKSQQALADALGTSQSTVGNWESGRRNPKHATAIQLAHFFGVSVDYLLGLEEKKELPAQGEELSIDELLDKMTVDELFDVLNKASERLRERHG